MRTDRFPLSLLARSALLLALLALAPSTPARAAEKPVLWGALVHATKTPGDAAMPPELAPFAPTLRREFGYNRFEILGQQEGRAAESGDRWIVPGGDFSLSVSARAPSAGHRPLDLQLYQDKKLLVKTEAELGEGAPLLIRGPLYGRGQLIIVLVLR